MSEQFTNLILKPVQKTLQEARQFCQVVNKEVKSAFPLPETEVLNDSSSFFWVKWQDQLVGTSGYTLRTPFLAEVRKTMIFPAYREQGLGRALCLKMEQYCHEAGIKKIMVTIYSDNHRMLCLRLKLNYIIEGFHQHHEAPGFHEYSLGKIIDLADGNPGAGT